MRGWLSAGGPRQQAARGVEPALPSLRDFRPLLELELARARRYGRPLAVISFPAGAEPLPHRVTDIMVYGAGARRVVLMLPETDAEAAAALVQRLQADGTGEIRFGTFPDDALTLESLLAMVVEE